MYIHCPFIWVKKMYLAAYSLDQSGCHTIEKGPSVMEMDKIWPEAIQASSSVENKVQTESERERERSL